MLRCTTERCEHRRYRIADLNTLMGIEQKRAVVGYARVSSHDQKDDLVRQADRLRAAGCDEVITDLGSGLNCKKKGLLRLLKGIVDGAFSKLIITHPDRLLRFGQELVFALCRWFHVEVVIIDEPKEVSFEMELTQDVITLMTVFSILFVRRSMSCTTQWGNLGKLLDSMEKEVIRIRKKC